MFTKVDMLAIEQGNSDYLLDVGAKYYREGEYEKAVRYYRVSASLGNMQAVNNLGYCYMYERSVPKDMELAVALFKVAANAGVIEAAAKLGELYGQEKYGMQDEELAGYYNETALNLVRDFGLFPTEFPSLCLANAKMHMPEGSLVTDIQQAFNLLRYAKAGYETKIREGETYYAKSLLEVKKLLRLDIFKGMAILDGDDRTFDLY